MNMIKTVVTLLFCFLVASCSTFSKPSLKEPKQDPLVVLNCPDLQQIDSTKEYNMGDLVLIIVEISSQYYLCKASALQTPSPIKKATENEHARGTETN